MFFAKKPLDPGAEQPFLSHLLELRTRIIRMLIAVAVAVLLLFPFANQIYTFVAGPLMAQLPEGNTMIATQVISPFLAPFKLALVAAIFLAMPYLLYQLWAFVAPGLYRHERRFAIPLLASSILLFYLGMAFAYYLAFPLIFGFMAATTPDGVAMMTDIAAYLDFVLALFFAFGIAFEIPIATILLVMVGITTPDALANQRPYVIVGAFVIGMLLTPPDVFSQTLLAVPMWLLFELGIAFSRLLLKRRRHETAETASTQLAPQKPATAGKPAPDTNPKPASSAFKATAPAPGAINSVDEKILRANRLRELNNVFAVRQVLYEVLEEGDADQRRVARDILNQLDD